jgi:hypothetical protein
MTSLVYLSDRHHRHHCHPPSSFKRLRATQVSLPSSPSLSPPTLLATGGDTSGDAGVTQSPEHPSPLNYRKHRGIWCQRASGDDGDVKISALSVASRPHTFAAGARRLAAPLWRQGAQGSR